MTSRQLSIPAFILIFLLASGISVSSFILPKSPSVNGQNFHARSKRADLEWSMGPTVCMPSGLPGLMSTIFQKEPKLLILRATLQKDDEDQLIVSVGPNTDAMINMGWVDRAADMEELFEIEKKMANEGCRHHYRIIGGPMSDPVIAEQMWRALSKNPASGECHWVFGWRADLQRYYPHATRASIHWLRSGAMLGGSQAEYWPLCGAEWEQFVQFWQREKLLLYSTVRLSFSWAKQCKVVMYDANLVEKGSEMERVLGRGKVVREIPGGVRAVSRIFCDAESSEAMANEFEAMKARNPSWEQLVDEQRGTKIHAVLVEQLAKDFFRTYELPKKEDKDKSKEKNKAKDTIF